NNVYTAFGQFDNTAGSANQGFQPVDTSGVGTTNQTFQQIANGPQQQAGFGGFSGSGTSTNVNAPQFSDATAQQGRQAAFDANTEMLKPQMEQDTKNLDAQLRLQGLMPGTEAYNNAAQNLSRTQGQQLNQIANQSV